MYKWCWRAPLNEVCICGGVQSVLFIRFFHRTALARQTCPCVCRVSAEYLICDQRLYLYVVFLESKISEIPFPADVLLKRCSTCRRPHRPFHALTEKYQYILTSVSINSLYLQISNCGHDVTKDLDIHSSQTVCKRAAFIKGHHVNDNYNNNDV